MKRLAENTPKFANDLHTKAQWVNSGTIREGAKVILKVPYFTQSRVAIKNQRVLLNRENLLKCLKLDFGYTG